MTKLIANAVFSSFTPYSQPFTYRIVQQEYAHDIITMSVFKDSPDAKRYVTGLPVQVTWGWAPNKTNIFYGYVNHVTQTNDLRIHPNLTDQDYLQIVCIGSTFPLKETAQNSWANMTTPQIVQAVSQQFRLASEVGSNGQVWPTQVQGGDSYFQFLVERSKKIGYTFYGSGMTLHSHPRTTNPAQVKGYIAQFVWSSAINNFQFSPSLGSNVPNAGKMAQREYTGINPRTLTPTSYTDSGVPSSILGTTVYVPIFTSMSTGTVATAYDEAATKVSGDAAVNQLTLYATLDGIGDPWITQGSLVYVANVKGAQDGLWYVTKAIHLVGPTEYHIQLILGRDSTGPTSITNIPNSAVSVPTARVVNGNWVLA